MYLEVNNNNGAIYKKEYMNKDKRFWAIYDRASTELNFKKLSKLPVSIADYSDGGIALYYGELPYELYSMFPENAYCYSIKLGATGEVFYRWYKLGNTVDIVAGFDVVAVGRQVGSDEVKLYSCAGGKVDDMVLWNKDFTSETYINGTKINESYYLRKEN